MPRKSKDYYERRVSAYARRIRDLREDHDMTQQEIANILHVSQRTYADYELGNVRIPVDAIIQLARHYNIDMNYICGVSRTANPFPEK